MIDSDTKNKQWNHVQQYHSTFKIFALRNVVVIIASLLLKYKSDVPYNSKMTKNAIFYATSTKTIFRLNYFDIKSGEYSIFNQKSIENICYEKSGHNE